jgi:hypothetical protein
MRVQVYWNLHSKTWSIRDAKTRRVVGHADTLELTNCKFKVSEAGRQRVIREKRKHVHAWIEGELHDKREVPLNWPGTKQVRYDPYRMSTFVCECEAVYEALYVRMNSDRTVFMK